MEKIENSLTRDGMELTSNSNIKSFVKRFEPLEYEEESSVLKKLFKHHYGKGNDEVFDTIRDELRILRGKEPPAMMPTSPRGQWYNVVHKLNGSSGSILIGDVIYTQKKNTGVWTYKGGKKSRKSRSRRQRRKTRKHT